MQQIQTLSLGLELSRSNGWVLGLILSLGMVLTPGAFAASYATSGEAAVQALRLFPALITPDTVQSMGFSEVSQLTGLTLGEPMAVVTVDLEALKSFDLRKKPEDIFKRGKQELYPVLLNGEVTSAIRLFKNDDGRWEILNIGQSHLVQALQGVQRQHQAKAGIENPSYFLVNFQEIYQMLLANRDGGQLYLTPVYDEERHGIQKGDTQPAPEWFKRLSVVAKKSPFALGPPLPPFPPRGGS